MDALGGGHGRIEAGRNMAAPPPAAKSLPILDLRGLGELLASLVTGASPHMYSDPCARCGEPLQEGERYCPACGRAVESPVTPHSRPARLGGEAGWRELRERLEQVTRGRYQIDRELGRGGMAAVFLAQELALHRRVAIKVMRPSFLLDDSLVERFLREARTMASFQHPNIVTVHAVEAIEDLRFFVMQYIAGQSLAQMVREFGSLPVAAVQSVIYQAGAGLSHAHRSGVIHRDVKPANVMIDAEGNAIVTDFGIAKLVDLDTSAAVGALGTPIYMSPEQCSGSETLTPASDQYALGTVAYELLAGRPPFERPTSVAQALAIVEEPPPPLRALRPDCPPEIEAAVLRMLAKRPADRFPTLNDAVAALGGEALTDDDPVRGFLAALARRDTPVYGPEALTPRRSRSGPTARVRAEDVTRRSSRRRLLAGGGVFATAAVFTVLAIVAAMKARSDRSIRPDTTAAVALAPPPPDPPVDSPAQGPDDPLPRPTPATPPPPPPTRSRDPSRVEPRETSSAVPVPTPGPAPAPAPVPPPPPAPADTGPVVSPLPPPPPPPPPPSREPAIRRVITEYVDAINARSLARMRALYPAMPPSRQKVWSDLFRDDVKDLEAVLAITDLVERGDLADASFTIDLSFRPERGDRYQSRIEMEATLRLENGSWKFLTLTP